MFPWAFWLILEKGERLTGCSFVTDSDEPAEQSRFLSDVARKVRDGGVIAGSPLLTFYLGHLPITYLGA
jgi:hypothetical protein